jgi:hypothetical protein
MQFAISNDQVDLSQREVVGRRLAAYLALTGLISGLLTCGVMDPRLQQAGNYTGIIFGVLTVVPLLQYKVLDRLWKALGLIAGTTLAYPCSVYVAIGFQMSFPQIVPVNERWDMGTVEPASPVALFVAGLAGGALVFIAVALFCRRGIEQSVVRMVLQGALVGGGLGFTAWVLRSSIGVAVWNMFHTAGILPPWASSPRTWFHQEYDYGDLPRLYALYVTWQTGMATAIGILLRGVTITKEQAESVLQLFSA